MVRAGIHLIPEIKPAWAYVLREQSLSLLQPSCKSHWFSNQLRELVFLVLDPRAGVPNMWFKPLTPQGGSPSPWYPSLLCPWLGSPNLIASPPFLPDSVWIFLYSLVSSLPPVSSLFSRRIAPHVDVFF